MNNFKSIMEAPLGQGPTYDGLWGLTHDPVKLLGSTIDVGGRTGPDDVGELRAEQNTSGGESSPAENGPCQAALAKRGIN